MDGYITKVGFIVKERSGMLDIYDASDNAYMGEIQNKTLDDYSVNGEIDSDSLDCDIYDALY